MSRSNASSPRRLALLLSLVLAAQAMADSLTSDRPMLAGSSYRLAGASIAWKTYIPQRSIDSIREFHLVDECIYGLGTNGWVWSIGARTGERRWSRQLVDEGYTLWQPVSGRRYQEDTVAFTRLMDLSILHLDDGMEVMSYRFTKPSSGPVAITEEFAISSGVDRRIRAYHLDRQFTAWMVDATGELTLPPLVVSDMREPKSEYGPSPAEYFARDDDVEEPREANVAAVEPVKFEFAESVYFADRSGEVGAGYASDKFKLFLTQLEGRPEGGLAADEKHLYVATTAQWLYALDRKEGHVVWRRRLARAPEGPPVVTAQNLYIGLRGGGMERLDLSGERPRITPLKDCRKFLAEWPARVVMLDNEGRVALFHKETWTRAATLEPGRFDLSISNPLNDAAFVGTERGELMCIRPANSLPLPANAFITESLRAAIAHREEVRKQEEEKEKRKKLADSASAAPAPPTPPPAEAAPAERIEDRLLADPLGARTPSAARP